MHEIIFKDNHSLHLNTTELIKEFKKLRNKKHMSLRDVEAKSGVNNGVVSRIESFSRIPTLDTFCKVANALGYEVILKEK